MAKKAVDLKRHLPSATFLLIVLLACAALAGVFIYAGIYNVGADSPHWSLVERIIQTARDDSIAAHSRRIAPPADLGSAGRISAGAGLYSEMCTGCHLGPGLERTEISQGLYPPAPELARIESRSPAEQFWIIKHGVKFTAMPAWGKTHSDDLIWDMVAFIRQLPTMSPARYEAAVASAPADHDEMMKEMQPGHPEAVH